MPTKCTAITARGTPCKAWAVPDTEPPRCAAHGGASKSPGAPPGNRNAEKHGFYSQDTTKTEALTIDEIIQILSGKFLALNDYLSKAETADFLAAFNALAESASRLSRLLRDKRALSGEAADGIAGAIGQALDEIASQVGADL